ncbi:MAG TPA: hypothetical protein VJH22_05620 [Candidatus Nanoarchaeia archaeon]|nr:hypothetical protein [Candidatus Nanoarchaeia archaeon]
MNTARFFVSLAGLAFATNLLWETLHYPLYVCTIPLVECSIVAAMIDVLLIGLVYLIVAGINGTVLWRPTYWNLIASSLLGLVIAILIEVRALGFGKWSYASAMPTVFGLGVSPLLQLTLLTPLVIWIAHRLATPKKKSKNQYRETV